MEARGVRCLTLAMVLMVGFVLVPAARAANNVSLDGGGAVADTDPASEVVSGAVKIPSSAVWVACFYYAGDNQLWDNGSNKYMVTDRTKGELARFANQQCQIHGVFGPGTVEVFEAKDPLQALITRKGFFVRHSYGTSFEVVGSVPGAADEQGGGNSSRGWKVAGGGSFPDGLFDIILMVTGRFYVDSSGYWVDVASASLCTEGAEEEEAVADADTTVVPGTEPDEDGPAADEPTGDEPAEGGTDVTDADAAEGQKPGDNVQQFLNDGIDGAQNVLNNVFDGAQNGAEHVGEFVSDTAQGIGNVAQNVGAGLQQIGQNVGNGLRQVGQNVVQGVANATDALVPNELNVRTTRTGRLTDDGRALVVENTPFGTVMYGITLASSPVDLQACRDHAGEVATVTGRWSTQTVQKDSGKLGMGIVAILTLKGSWEE